MAIYVFQMKHGQRSKNQRAAAHARYILRLPPYTYNADHLKHSESVNLPSWAKSEVHFWDCADRYSRSNARLYTEFLVSVPRELELEHQVYMVKSFVEKEIGDRHACTFAVHHGAAHDGQENHHAHIMFCTRADDGIERGEEIFFKTHRPLSPACGGAKHDPSWLPVSRLKDLRESWGQTVNRVLDLAGLDVRVDHRSLKERGIDRIPEPKLTPFESMLWSQGIATEKVERVKALRELRLLQEKKIRLEILYQRFSHKQLEVLLKQYEAIQREYEQAKEQLYSSMNTLEVIQNESRRYTDILTFEYNEKSTLLHNGYTEKLHTVEAENRIITHQLTSQFDYSRRLHEEMNTLLSKIRSHPDIKKEQEMIAYKAIISVGQNEGKTVAKEHKPVLSRTQGEKLRLSLAK